ncbi:MAG: hypothetical protein DRG30_10095, partial [Epsilonproteobacteria bacterium]
MAQLKMGTQVEPTDDSKNHLYPSSEDLLLHYKNSDNVDGIIPRVFVKSTAPTTTDDSDSGYIKTDIWQDDVGKKIYTLNDATVGAAVWIAATVSSLAADDVTVVDSEDYFVGDNVETVLAEIGETRFFNGFDTQVETSMPELGWDDATRAFSCSIKSGASDFYFWAHGKKFTKTTTQSVVIPDITGTYYVYFDNSGSLQSVVLASLVAAVFYENAIAGLVYWNATSGKGMVGYELHGIRMSARTHQYNHDTFGARYASGMDINGLVDGSDVYTNIESGVFWDEDVRHTPALHTNTPFIYRLGASGEWTGTTPDLNVSHNAGGSYDVWNEWTGSTWQLSEGTSSTDYWIVFLIATPDFASGYRYKKIIGQSAYSSRSRARNAIESEKSRLIVDGLPSTEFVFLYAWIVKRNGEIEDDGDGNAYYDLRTERGGGSGSSAQASLAGDVVVDATGFAGLLSTTDTDVQKALGTLDSVDADDIGETATRKWAGEAGAEVNPDLMTETEALAGTSGTERTISAEVMKAAV